MIDEPPVIVIAKLFINVTAVVGRTMDILDIARIGRGGVLHSLSVVVLKGLYELVDGWTFRLMMKYNFSNLSLPSFHLFWWGIVSTTTQLSVNARSIVLDAADVRVRVYCK
jgi:hypothetical protein